MGSINGIAGTIYNEDIVDKDGWVNLEAWTGRPITHLPRSIRERYEALTHCSSITAVVGDWACDPRFGGIAGFKHLAGFYGVGEQQFRRNILPHLGWARWLANIPVTNVSSVAAHATLYREEVYRLHCEQIGVIT